MLCSGLQAWVICPEKITRTIHADSFETLSKDFVHSAMWGSCIGNFSNILDMARSRQIENKGPRWTGRELVNDHVFDLFDFDLFFLLGGLDTAFLKTSLPQFRRDRENQRLPVWCVVALLHFIHQRVEARRTDRSLPQWKVNRAKIDAAKFLLGIGIRKGVSGDTIRNHWESLRLSAALIYAAALTDNGHMLTWLLADADPYGAEFVARFIPAWFKCANSVADQLLTPLELLHKNWKSLDVDGVQEMPAALTDERMRELLTRGLTEKDIRAHGTERSGEMVIEEDGSRYFIPNGG